jgi:hypothetical protein
MSDNINSPALFCFGCVHLLHFNMNFIISLSVSTQWLLGFGLELNRICESINDEDWLLFFLKGSCCAAQAGLQLTTLVFYLLRVLWLQACVCPKTDVLTTVSLLSYKHRLSLSLFGTSLIFLRNGLSCSISPSAYHLFYSKCWAFWCSYK